MLAIRLKTFALPRLAVISGLVYFSIALLLLPRYLQWDANLLTGSVLGACRTYLFSNDLSGAISGIYCF